MFDISWGEIAILGAVGVAVTGKRDLPKACNFVGQQLGRVVGLLQGARSRADQFAHHNELRSLQNELRSGLRELDQVKTELALAASPKGVMGRNLGATTSSANYPRTTGTTTSTSTASTSMKPSFSSSPLNNPAVASPLFQPSPAIRATNNNNITSGNTANNSKTTTTQPLSLSDFDFQIDDDKASSSEEDHQQHSSVVLEQELSPVAQSERATMEEEWNKQGIGFRARAEGESFREDGSSNDGDFADTTRATGSELLEHLERQCLIFDQYDRVVGEQEKEMEQRVERIRNERIVQSKNNNDKGNNENNGNSTDR